MMDRTALRLSATLLLVGQLLYIVVTLFHTSGDANDHPAIFAAYAASATWTADHLGQFVAMAILASALCGDRQVPDHFCSSASRRRQSTSPA